MKTNAVLRRIISALLIFLLFFAAGCAPPPEVFEEEQEERTDEPFNEDGTCYTQSALLPEGFEVDPLANPRLTVIGDTLVLTDTKEPGQRLDPFNPYLTEYVWDLSTNLLEEVQIQPILSRPQTYTTSFQHIPCEDSGAVQLMVFQYDPSRYLSPEDEHYNDPVTNEVILAAQNPDGSIRFTLDVDALINDGYTHSPRMLRDGVTGYIYLCNSIVETLILDADGVLLDRIPWTYDNRSEYCYTADNRVYLIDRRSNDTSEWTYSAYDPDAHAFVPADRPIWTGYQPSPVGDGTWYEISPDGFTLYAQNHDDTVEATKLISWTASGFTHSSIRGSFVHSDTNGKPCLTAFTKNYETGRTSLTLFDPYRPYTAPERNELRLYADETWHTLQEVVVAFNAENVLYRVVYTDSPEDADLYFCNRHEPLPETPLADLYPHIDADIFIQRQHLLPGALSAFENDAGELQIIPVRTALSLSCNHEEPNKNDYITSPADYLCAVLTHDAGEIDAAPPIIEPIIGLAIPSTAADPNAAWKFISYFLRSETLDTLRSGADEGFSLWQNLFGEQLDAYYGAYAAHRDHRFTFTYPKEEDPETYDPMTDANFAAAVHDGAHYVRFDRDQRGVLAGFFGMHSES